MCCGVSSTATAKAGKKYRVQGSMDYQQYRAWMGQARTALYPHRMSGAELSRGRDNGAATEANTRRFRDQKPTLDHHNRHVRSMGGHHREVVSPVNPGSRRPTPRGKTLTDTSDRTSFNVIAVPATFAGGQKVSSGVLQDRDKEDEDCCYEREAIDGRIHRTGYTHVGSFMRRFMNDYLCYRLGRG